MKALVVGAGQMGVPIAFAMNRLGFKVVLTDLFKDTLDKAADKLDKTIDFITQNEITLQRSAQFDVCISAAPFNANLHWAEWCKQSRIPYCDLGGNQAISEKIQNNSRLNNPEIPVFTDLGLAPGLANILAEQVYREQAKRDTVKSVYLRVGGLPVRFKNDSKLKYAQVFSIKGLLNEYSGKCQTIRYGEIEEVDALSGLESLRLDWRNMEAFNTSGGLSNTLELMLNRGVQHLNYKTIRYEGHCQQIQFLLKECELDEQRFTEIIEKTCLPTMQDIVFIKVWAKSKDGSEVVKKIQINYDNQWTAMQKATAFPVAAIAAMMAEKRWKESVLNYSDVPFEEFADILDKIGFINIRESMVCEGYN